MHDTQPGIPVAAARARVGRRPQVIIGVLSGLAALCLVGVALAALILPGQPVEPAVGRTYPPDDIDGLLAYDLHDPAPTSYGSFVATAVQLSNADQFEVNVTLKVENRQLLPIKAPTPDQFRVVSTAGAEGAFLGGGWRGGPQVGARSTTSGEFRFAAPPAGGMLLLEYRERPDDTPIRVSVGYAVEPSDASSAASAASST